MPPKASTTARAAAPRGAKEVAGPARISTRSKAKPPNKTDLPNAKSPVNGTSNGNLGLSARKITRSSSNISTYSQIFVGGPPTPITATYKKPILTISGLTEELLVDLERDDEQESGKSSQRSDQQSLGREDGSSDERGSPEPPTTNYVPNPPSRRGGRGGRRGGRGGRGGRAKSTVSPRKARPTRTAAPTFPLTNVDEEMTSEHDSPTASDNDSGDGEEPQDRSDESMEPEIAIHVEPATTSPRDTPAPSLRKQDSDMSNLGSMRKLELSPRKESVAPPSRASGSATPANSQITPAIEIIEEELSDSDLPPVFLDEWPAGELEYEDRPDEILKNRFKPMNPLSVLIAPLLKGEPAKRPTAVLRAIAGNTFDALLAIQNEFLKLDERTAPHSHPPKKPATGGRIPIDTLVFEDIKEAELYSYVYDAKKAPGTQDPFLQRIGRDYVGGRELRQRRAARDMLGSAAASEDDDDEEEGGRTGKRRRRAVQRFDGTETGNGTETPPRRFGWGGARKRGVSAITGSQTPEVERRGKRTKTEGQLLPQRIREMRGESMMNSSGDSGEDGSPVPDTANVDPNKRRGRPPGSKNLQKRSDAGIKKGPRKGTFGGTLKTKPMTLESLSQGQNQFAIEPMIQAPNPVAPSHPVMPPSSTVFQAAPQPATAPPSDSLSRPTAISASAEQYITTTPLSQYGSNYVDEPTTPNGSNSEKKRKQRVKSEKRSQSMTIWWAERKARAAERKMAEMKASGQQMHHDPRAGGNSSPSLSNYSGPMGIQYSHPHTPTLAVSSGLTALSSSGGRNSMPLLAPAPSPSLAHTRPPPTQQMYRSAYPPPQDPRGLIQRPSSGEPLPLAPAPPAPHRHSLSHIPPPISPYGPPQGQSQPQVYQPLQHQHQSQHRPGNPYGHTPQLAPAPERREEERREREMEERRWG